MKAGWLVCKLLLLLFFCSTYHMIQDRTAVTPEPAEAVQLLEAAKEGGGGMEPPTAAPKEKKPKKPEPNKEEKQRMEPYEKARKKNPAVIGWISVPGMKYLDYPIVKAEDNQYYLTHNANNEETAEGAIFLDAGQKGEFGPINIIHGHNMKNETMFGELDSYKRKSFAREHQAIHLLENGAWKQYQVFSVFVMDAKREQLETGFAEEAAYQAYVKSLKLRSKFSLPCPEKTGRLLILNTCSYEFSGAHLLVCALEKEE